MAMIVLIRDGIKMSKTFSNILCRIKWQTSRWGPCSVTCGVGQMIRSVKCFDSITQLDIDDQYCTEEKPTNISTCKHPTCPEWNIGRWEDVSKMKKLKKKNYSPELYRCFNTILLIPHPSITSNAV